MYLIKTMPMKRHKFIAKLFDEDFGRRYDEVRIAVIHNDTLPAHG